MLTSPAEPRCCWDPEYTHSGPAGDALLAEQCLKCSLRFEKCFLASGHVQLLTISVSIFFTPHQQQDGFGTAFQTLIDSNTALKREVRGNFLTAWSLLELETGNGFISAFCGQKVYTKPRFVAVLVEYLDFMQARVQLKDIVLLCH